MQMASGNCWQKNLSAATDSSPFQSRGERLMKKEDYQARLRHMTQTYASSPLLAPMIKTAHAQSCYGSLYVH